MSSFNGRETAAEVNLVAVLPSLPARLARPTTARLSCGVDGVRWNRKDGEGRGKYNIEENTGKVGFNYHLLEISRIPY